MKNKLNKEIERVRATKVNDELSVIRQGVIRGRREQITHTMPPEMLANIDSQARARGMTRAGYINFAISERLNKDSGAEYRS